MTKRSLLGAFFLLVLLACGRAFSQGAIGVFDEQVIKNRSLAWKSLRAGVETLRTSYQKQITDYQRKVQRQGEFLELRRSVLSEKAQRKEQKRLRRMVNYLRELTDKHRKNIDNFYSRAREQIRQAMHHVVASIAKERNVVLILKAGIPSGVVFFASRRLILTDEILKRLNARLRKVNMPLFLRK